MQIEHDERMRTRKIRDLEHGAVFKWGGDLYMRTCRGPSECVAVALTEDASWISINALDSVVQEYFPEAKLHLGRPL